VETTVDQTDRIVEVVRAALGDIVIGAYLHGSSVVGGLQPASDIDVLVVTSRLMTYDEKRSLIASLLPISGRGDSTGRSRSVELTIVVQSDVRPWRYPPRLDFQYGEWWRTEFERGESKPWESPNPDLALLIEMVLQASRPLMGPPPAEVLGPVPPADFRRALLDVIPGLLVDIDGDEGNVVLTFARIWTTLATGAIRSKSGAADWALSRLPAEHRSVLERAKAIYLSGAPEDWTDLRPRVRPHINRVLEEIESLRPQDGPEA
jgi:streptomycin 3"-adenylyltransferase